MNLVDRLVLPTFGKHPMTNSEIYRAVRRRARRQGIRLSPHWRATIRNTLQRHCFRHPKCQGEALFVHVGRALWRRR